MRWCDHNNDRFFDLVQQLQVRQRPNAIKPVIMWNIWRLRHTAQLKSHRRSRHWHKQRLLEEEQVMTQINNILFHFIHLVLVLGLRSSSLKMSNKTSTVLKHLWNDSVHSWRTPSQTKGHVQGVLPTGCSYVLNIPSKTLAMTLGSCRSKEGRQCGGWAPGKCLWICSWWHKIPDNLTQNDVHPL